MKISCNYSQVPVIYYHSISGIPLETWNRNFLTLKLKYFEDQIKWIKKNYHVIDLYEYFKYKSELVKIKKDCIVITFDDGFLDNWVWAFPLLRKYQVKATLFISPEFIDNRQIVRPTLQDYWNSKIIYSGLDSTGYLSWDEIKLMHESNLIDFQSHTLTHTKYFVSDKILNFYHPGFDALYTIGNIFPDYKPYSMDNEEFNNLIPYGYPIFEEASAVIAKRVWINEKFNNEVINTLINYNWNKYSFEHAFKLIEQIYKYYKKTNQLIKRYETEQEYEQRLYNEIKGSKKIIEETLNKPVDFLCWPHGDNNPLAHEIAIKSGYKATTLGNLQSFQVPSYERIENRIGSNPLHNSRLITLTKVIFRIKSKQKKFPYYMIHRLYNYLHYVTKQSLPHH